MDNKVVGKEPRKDLASQQKALGEAAKAFFEASKPKKPLWFETVGMKAK